VHDLAAARETRNNVFRRVGRRAVPSLDAALVMQVTPDLRSASSVLAALAARYAGCRSDRWAPVSPELDAAVGADVELAEAARWARTQLVAELARRFEFPARFLDAVHLVPRERFVLPEDIAASADDTPLPLDRDGHATVSAPHAYLLTYDLLGLTEGDHLLELGTGTGYGVALARRILGPAGRITSIEIDPVLCERASRLLGASKATPDRPSLSMRRTAAPSSSAAGVTLFCGDGRAIAERVLSDRPPPARPWKIAVTYAVSELPAVVERLLSDGGVLAAPVGAPEGHQELMRVEREGGVLRREAHGAVRYVSERRRG
jgi:protein-L-isoaspartate(D-aspartate) O-methyltransferase